MKTSLEASPLLIEVWSDVVCPWCYIGKRNLESALINFVGKDKVAIKHRAFRLDPLAHVIRPTLTALGEKYAGGAPQVLAMIDRVSKVASDVGLKFRLAETQTGNTLDAHRLLLGAQSEDEVKSLLASDAFADEVDEDQTMAARLGANGVPFFVIDRKYGLSGAQPVDSFAQILVKASV